MRYLGESGFELQDIEASGIIIDAGSSIFVTFDTNVPADSNSSRSLELRNATVHRPWYTGSTASSTPRSPSGTRWGFQLQYSHTTAHVDLRCGVSSGAGEILSLNKDPTSGKLAIYIAGSKVAEAASYTPSLGTFVRYTVDVLNTVGGHVKVYADGDVSTPVIDHTLAAVMTAPDSFWFKAPNIGGCFFDDAIAWEWGVGLNPDLLDEVIDASVALIVPNAAGNYSDWSDGVGGTGTFDLVDEVPYSDTDYIEATATDEATTFAFEDTTEARVLFACVCARVTRAGTDAGQQLQVRARSGTTDLDFPSSATGAPGDGHIIVPIDSLPSGARLDAAADFNAIEFGPVSRT